MRDKDNAESGMEQDKDASGYMGNIFGWKVSLIGLAVILLLILAMYARQRYLENHGGLKEVQDSVKIENPYRQEY